MEQSQSGNRHERRKAATRAALVEAARALLVEDGAEVSIQAIADRADVALGSFYNHFPGRSAIFAAVATDALREFEASLLARTAHLDGAASVLASRMRLYGRMCDTHPEIATVLMRLPPSPDLAPRGYSLKALEDVRRSVDAGELAAELAAEDLDIRMIAVVGSLRHLVVLRQRDSSIGPERVDDLVEVLLEMFGLERSVARDLAHRPLDVADDH